MLNRQNPLSMTKVICPQSLSSWMQFSMYLLLSRLKTPQSFSIIFLHESTISSCKMWEGFHVNHLPDFFPKILKWENFYFVWETVHRNLSWKKSAKLSEIAIFALLYFFAAIFGVRKCHTHTIVNVKNFLEILIENLISFQMLFIFWKIIIDLLELWMFLCKGLFYSQK